MKKVFVTRVVTKRPKSGQGKANLRRRSKRGQVLVPQEWIGKNVGVHLI